MKILTLLPRVPYPLEKGDKLRAFHFLKGLSKNNEVILCALNDSRLHPQAEEKVRSIVSELIVIDLPKGGIIINMIRAVMKGLPFQVGYFYNSNAEAQIHDLINKHKPDVIFCQLLRTAQYITGIKYVPRVIDFQDVFSAGMKRRIGSEPFWKKIFVKKEAVLLHHYEQFVMDELEGWIIITEQDRNAFPHEGSSEIRIISNGVDSEFFSPSTTEKKFDIVFTGNMAYPPNIRACEYIVRDILPILNKKKPGLKILLAGATPVNRVKDLAGPQVTVSGWMDDIRDAYSESSIFLAPMMIGTGLQNKLLEAMSMGLPCITSSLANNALGAIPDQEILVADHAVGFAEHICSLLESEKLAEKLANAGRKMVIEKFAWEAKCTELNQYLEEVVKKK